MRPSSVLLFFLAIAAAHPASAREPVAIPSTPPETVAAAETEAATATETPPPAPEALLLVTVNVRGASIIVDDGEPIVAPTSALRVSSGAHTIRVSAEGYDASERSIQVPHEGARVDVFLEPSEALTARIEASEDTYESSDNSGAHKKWWLWAAIGGGAVVVAAVIAAVALASGGDDGQTVVPVPPIPENP